MANFARRVENFPETVAVGKFALSRTKEYKTRWNPQTVILSRIWSGLECYHAVV